jgi:hypothetical protein
VPYAINQSGSYFVTRDLAGVSGQDGITIAANDVTLDLNGFALIGTLGQLTTGIRIDSGAERSNIVVRNGAVRSWDYGLRGDTAVESVFEDVVVTQSTYNGIVAGSSSTIRRVVARQNGVGVAVSQVGTHYGGTISDSDISENTNRGIELAANNFNVRDNTLMTNAANGAIVVRSSFCWIEHNAITGNVPYGIWLLATASNDTVVRNFLVGNAVQDSGVSDRIGSSTATVNGTDPLSNIVY